MKLYKRRTNGAGKRPADTTIRITAELAKDLREMRDREPGFVDMSLSEMLQELVDGFRIRKIIHGYTVSWEVDELRKLAGKLYTPSPKLRGSLSASSYDR